MQTISTTAGDKDDHENDESQRRSHDMTTTTTTTTTTKRKSEGNSQQTSTNETRRNNHIEQENDPLLKYATSDAQLEDGTNAVHEAIIDLLSSTDHLQEILTKTPELALEQENDPFLKYAPSESQLEDRLNILHVAIRDECSWIHLREMLTKQPELAQPVDRFTFTPLHRALVQEEFFFQVGSLLAILNAYPDAAKIPNGFGTYPLHTAINCILSKYYVGGSKTGGGGAGGEVGGPSARGHHGQIPLDLALIRQSNLFFIDRLIQIFPEAINEPHFLSPTILHMVLDRTNLNFNQRTREDQKPLTIAAWQESQPVVNEKACIELILRANPSAAFAVDPENGRLPLHTAMKDGTVPSAIIRLLLDACPLAVEVRDYSMELPLHLGLRSLEIVFLEKEASGEGFRNMLEAITAVLNRNPNAASTRDNYGYTPLFKICQTLQEAHPHSEYASQVMKKIFKAYPSATEIACYMGLCPLNILVEECSKAVGAGTAASALPENVTALTQSMKQNSIFKLRILLAAVRDGRALSTMCNLRNPGSLLALFLLFDEDHNSFKSADSRGGRLLQYQGRIPLVNLNKQLIPGWTLLEILTDFDTVDSSNTVLQIVQGQRGKLNRDGAEFCIEYQDEDTPTPQAVLHFASSEAVREAVLMHVADRAKLSKSSLELKRWGQEHGRMLRRYRVQRTPKHISETCVVVFATEAKENADGHHFESLVALKFMSQGDAFLREIEKRRGTEEAFVLPIRAFFTKAHHLAMDCDYIGDQNFLVDLPDELALYPNISLKSGDAAGDQSMLEYLLVMECGSGTDLHDVIGHQNIAGKDPFSVILIAKEIARCLQFLNEKCGIIHGDVKARNFVLRGVGLLGFAAIDLDNSASIVKGETVGKKRTSSGCLPPEQASVEEFRRSSGLMTPKDNLSIDYIKNELVPKAMAAQDWLEVARLSQQLAAQASSGQTIAPADVVATIQYDMWCFGVLLYYLCTGIQLFNVDVQEELAEEDDLVKLKLWEAKVKSSKLAKVGHGWPRELLKKLLEKDPSTRPKRWSIVIDELNKLGMNQTIKSDPPIEQLRHDRVVVFRSDPLVGIDAISRTPFSISRVDYEKEADMLLTSLRDANALGNQIDVVFEYATTDALSAFFAQRSSRVLHFSGHGHPEYLALENGFGRLQAMLVDDLKQYVSKGAGNLQLVVVSACHSRDTGEAFILAGVPHVVCCQLEERLLDTGARVFAGNLYRALACGSNLQAAFDMAREAVRFSPMVENSSSEAGKFLLLPEQGVDHDIPVFFTNPIPQLLPMNEQLQMNGVPRLPQDFVGRDVCMFNVISALRNADLIRVGGIVGIGKSCIVSAICGYMVQRPRSFPMDYLFWLEPSSFTSTSKGKIYSSPYQELASAFAAAFEDDFLTDKTEYSLSLDRLSKLLDQKRIYLVFNRCRLENGQYAESMETFIRDLLTIASVKTMKIILLSSTKYEGSRLHGRHETSLQIKSLDLESTAIVFSSHLPVSLRSRYPSLSRHLFPPEGALHEPYFQDHYKELWTRLGKGIPSRIRTNAMNMTDEGMLAIINWWRMRPT
jgi:serine/threonine protein kinase